MSAPGASEVQASTTAPAPIPQNGDQLPAYSATAGPPSAASAPVDGKVNINAAFEALSLSDSPQPPSSDTCLAHLKLLFAFHTLKSDIGYTDGLWGVWDSLADSLEKAGSDDKRLEPVKPDDRMAGLSRLREKRWAIFVARAVDRYVSWWDSLPANYLTNMYMESSFNYPEYAAFPDGAVSERIMWTELKLLPLDVLMVFHTHMLNPRAFLEDCIRTGRHALWLSGLPWRLVNAAIDNDFNYKVSDETKAHWVAQTGCSWDNVDDPVVKTIKCPSCDTSLQIPWTTCGLETTKTPSPQDLIGNGYGDGNLSHACAKCKLVITKDLLCTSKFVGDVKMLILKSVPMPGTIIDIRTGKPEPWANKFRRQMKIPRTFPNRMILAYLRSPITDLIPSNPTGASINKIKELIEGVLADKLKVRTIDSVFGANYRLPVASRVAVRKMLSRYWDNFSPLALDLTGAVMRQGVFVDKMYKIDWLHSPAASSTMKRLLTKYQRFFAIMAENPRKIAVPTLDVDLAWHTAQLSPKTYYDFSLATCDKFIDHDDKIEEDALSTAFEWTSKTYQETHGEVYSECTCWYCETIREGHISSVGKLLGMSKNEKVADSFHASGAAQLCPPDASAHISSHNAVRAVSDASHALFNKRLDAQYEKACKRAEKKGRKIPSRREYYDHWAYSYYMYGPWVYPMYLYPGMYVGAPFYAPYACAAGSCGSGGGCGGTRRL